MIHAWTGEVDAAIEQLDTLSKPPGGPDYGQLKYDPAWSAVRSDTRYGAIADAARHPHRGELALR